MKSSFFTLLAIAASVVGAQNITCETQQQDCDFQTGANHACCSSLYASCTAGTTTPDSPYNQCSNGPPCPTCTASVPAATASTVSSACADQLSICDSQVGANHACCAALQASCLAGTVVPESDVSQCSNGPPCPTCTSTASEYGTGSATSTSSLTSTSTALAYGNGSTTAYSPTSTSSLTSTSTSSVLPFTGDAGTRLGAGGIFAAGLAVAFML